MKTYSELKSLQTYIDVLNNDRDLTNKMYIEYNSKYIKYGGVDRNNILKIE